MIYISLKKFIMLSRPMLFPIIFFSLIVALLFSTPINSISVYNILEIIFVTFLLPFFTFAINDVYDYESDKNNLRKDNIFQGFYFKDVKSLSKTIRFYDLLIFLFLILFSLIFNNLIHTILLFSLLFVCYFYSTPPLRFKEIPFIDSISNALIAFLLFSMIFVLNNNFNSRMLFAIITISLAIMSYHLIGAQIDVDSDKKSKQRTTAVFINNRSIVYLISIIYNLPLLFVHFNSIFKIFFYFNILFIIYMYFSRNSNKKKLVVIFLTAWILLTIIYIVQKLLFYLKIK